MDDDDALEVEEQGVMVETVLKYTSFHNVMDSDHKPVKGVFNVRIEVVDEQQRRKKYSTIVAQQSVNEIQHHELPDFTSLRIESMPVMSL